MYHDKQIYLTHKHTNAKIKLKTNYYYYFRFLGIFAFEQAHKTLKTDKNSMFFHPQIYNKHYSQSLKYNNDI